MSDLHAVALIHAVRAVFWGLASIVCAAAAVAAIPALGKSGALFGLGLLGAAAVCIILALVEIAGAGIPRPAKVPTPTP